MPKNGQVICQGCHKPAKVAKSGMGKYHIDCSCGQYEKPLEANQAASMLQIDQIKLHQIAVNLMTTDVCC